MTFKDLREVWSGTAEIVVQNSGIRETCYPYEMVEKYGQLFDQLFVWGIKPNFYTDGTARIELTNPMN